MSRSNKKSQYTQKEKRSIYVLKNPRSNEFFVGHCRADLLRDVFKHHLQGKRYKTKECVEILKSQGLHPCLFVLEEVFATKVEAYNYVIVWTKIFLDAGLKNLDEGNVIDYGKDLSAKNIDLYQARNGIDTEAIFICEKCKVIDYGRTICSLWKEKNYGKRFE